MRIKKVLEIDYEFANNDENFDKKYFGLASPDEIILFFGKDLKILARYKRVT